MTAPSLETVVVETDIPSRLDHLPWLRFHTLVAAALGVTWLLDGLEVTLVGSLSGALKSSPTLHLTDAEVGLSASGYLLGAVLGALVFGWLADRLGRKRLFNITLGLYLLATALTATATGFHLFVLFRFLTGAGIGGEYTAINSAIQELIPARYRGRTDLVINGSFWIGAALGALAVVLLLHPGRFGPDVGWRVAFGIGAFLGLGVLFLRHYVPESPRWLMTHGHLDEAERITKTIEAHASGPPRVDPTPKLRLRFRQVGLYQVARVLFRSYPKRSAVSVVLMATQAFFYNAIFFTYALVLSRFFGVASASVGLYLLPFAAGNFLGPLLLGRLFDEIGRRVMITFTYAASGVLLGVTALLFVNGWLDATSQTIAWSVVFFFASAAASSAYLTVGESFPLEMRALAIALFYTLGTATGGLVAPWLFGTLIGSGDRSAIAYGYAVGGALMLVGAGTQWWFGLAAEGRSLEALSPPLSQAPDAAIAHTGGAGEGRSAS